MIEKRVSFDRDMVTRPFLGEQVDPGITVEILYISGYEEETIAAVEKVFNSILKSMRENNE